MLLTFCQRAVRDRRVPPVWSGVWYVTDTRPDGAETARYLQPIPTRFAAPESDPSGKISEVTHDCKTLSDAEETGSPLSAHQCNAGSSPMQSKKPNIETFEVIHEYKNTTVRRTYTAQIQSVAGKGI